MRYSRGANTDKKGVNKLLSSSGNYQQAYGGTLHSFFKPFTTNATGYGVPHYVPDQRGTGVTADSSGLNPYGQYTLNEGILHGTVMPVDLDLDAINPLNVRAHGFKTPVNHVGPGFDEWGYPSPNFSVPWAVSGSLSQTAPSTLYAGVGTGSVEHLHDVPPPIWPAGPTDLRWSQERGCFTSPVGVFPARITRVVASGITNPATGFFWAEDIRYDAQIVDGIANSIEMTGLTHIGPSPESGTYKVSPFGSGDYCFMMRCIRAGAPAYGIWLMELPGVEECASTAALSLLTTIATYSGAVDGNPAGSTRYLTGSGYYNGLTTYPLPLTYGGLGFNTVDDTQVIVGITGNAFTKKTLVAGSGIAISHAATGITISLTSGITGLFALAGANNDITSLAGLTTPLSLLQGGTAATGKVWVDMTTTQSVSGSKTFVSPIRWANTNTIANLPIASSKDSTIGMWVHPSGQGLAFVHKGTGWASVNSTGLTSFGQFNAVNSYDNTNPAVIISNTASGPNYTLCFKDALGTGMAYIGPTGIQLGPNNFCTRIRMATGVVGNQSLTLPSGGVVPNTVSVYDHLVFNEHPSGLVNGVNGTFYTAYPVYSSGKIHVYNSGLLQNFGAAYDYILSNSTGIIFNTGRIPASGNILTVMYQRTL